MGTGYRPSTRTTGRSGITPLDFDLSLYCWKEVASRRWTTEQIEGNQGQSDFAVDREGDGLRLR